MMNRRTFNKILCMAFPGIWLPWSITIEALAQCTGHSGPIALSMDRYFMTGMNMVLVDHGVYISKIVALRAEDRSATVIEGIAHKIIPTHRKDNYVVDPIEAKYFLFLIGEEAMCHVEARQAALKEAINNILKSFGKGYL